MQDRRLFLISDPNSTHNGGVLCAMPHFRVPFLFSGPCSLAPMYRSVPFPSSILVETGRAVKHPPVALALTNGVQALPVKQSAAELLFFSLHFAQHSVVS